MSPQKTLVIYSGPTSMNRHVDKNGIYHDNMVYFLENGISCNDDNIPMRDDDDNNDVIVKYVFVLTKEVADYYTAPNGPITKIREKCNAIQQKHGDIDNKSPGIFIDVKTREDRCYDMESMRIVLNEIDVRASYDNLLFLNCGMVGPKLGPGSPKLIPTKDADGRVDTSKLVPYSHWTQLYTSRLDEEVRMVGQSINTHFHTFFPHVQSFLYAITTETASILTSAGAIYDCGLKQIEFATHPEKRYELIERYEVGMSTTLLKQGYKIATAFLNRWDMGNTLVLDSNSINEEKYKTIYGVTLDDTLSDMWYESGLRNLTSVLNRDMPRDWWRRDSGKDDISQLPEVRKKANTYDYHKYDLLPWDYFVFFKVSRLVTEDIQKEINYNTLAENDVLVVSSDPRKSPDEFWLRKMGVLGDTPMYVLVPQGYPAIKLKKFFVTDDPWLSEPDATRSKLPPSFSATIYKRMNHDLNYLSDEDAEKHFAEDGKNEDRIYSSLPLVIKSWLRDELIEMGGEESTIAILEAYLAALNRGIVNTSVEK